MSEKMASSTESSPCPEMEKSIENLLNGILDSPMNNSIVLTPLHDIAQNQATTSGITPTTTRKRLRNPKLWKKNIRKELRQHGLLYKDRLGKTHEPRCVQSNLCGRKCDFHCTSKISIPDRHRLNSRFWDLSDAEKRSYYAKFVTSHPVKRHRVENSTKKIVSYEYFFEVDTIRIRVCQNFFLGVLSISKSRIYYFFKTALSPKTGTPKSYKHGKHVKYKIAETKIDEIKNHINSFATIESHYCRANTKKKYLDPTLNITKMYNLYCIQTTEPVKKNIYDKVFNENFNLAFHVPKKDVCDKCSLQIKESDHSSTMAFNLHKEKIEKAKKHRTIDRALSNFETAVICYDLQNVFALPKGAASNFFYRRKFNTYNLTGICNLNNKTYCCIWYESLSGRTGNDIASAIVRILTEMLRDLPTVKNIILWSDSCVPQNRNRVTSLALLKWLEANPSVLSIEQKFSEAGHSLIQEIDAVHSCIERHLRPREVYSPVSLLMQLKQMRYKKVSLHIIQMGPKDFYNYNAAGIKLKFIPYASVKHIMYNGNALDAISYKTDFDNTDFSIQYIHANKDNRNNRLPKITVCQGPKNPINAEKKKDIIAMFPFMNAVDVEFYKAVLKI